jgi:hypothetical protein
MPQLDIFAFNSILYTSFFVIIILYGVSVRIVLPSIFKILKFRLERERLYANSSDLLIEEINLLFNYGHSLNASLQSSLEADFRSVILNTYLSSQFYTIKILTKND